MISWMQNNNKFTIIVMWIAAGSFILSTAVIGASSGFRSNTIGKVGSVELKQDRLQMQYSQLFNQYNQMFQGRFDKKQAKAMGLEKQVLNRMESEAKLLNLAKEFGVVVTEEETAKELASYPAFQTDGKFDRKIYDTYLKNSGLSHETFENSLKDQLTVSKTLALLNVESLENEYNAFKVAFEVADKLKYTILTEKDVNVTVDDAKVKEFWEARKENYKTPTKYTIDIQWTDSKDAVATEEELQEYYNKHRFDYKDKEGKILPFEEVKKWVEKATKIANTKKDALKNYVKFKKAELPADETLTLDINDPKLSPELWSEIRTKNVNDILKPKVVETKYATVKINNIVKPKLKTFEEVKEQITPLYLKERTKNEISLLAEKKLNEIDKLDMNVSNFITLDNAKTQKIGINEQETSNFVSSLFTSEQEKGIIPIGSKVIVYKIIEQKLISLENNETSELKQSADKVKNQSFQANLIKMLDKKYPTTLY